MKKAASRKKVSSKSYAYFKIAVIAALFIVGCYIPQFVLKNTTIGEAGGFFPPTFLIYSPGFLAFLPLMFIGALGFPMIPYVASMILNGALYSAVGYGCFRGIEVLRPKKKR